MVLIESDRLLIRSFKEGDIDPYYEIVSDIDVMKFIGNGSVNSIDEATTYVRECIDSFKKNGWSRFAVELKNKREFIGFCGFKNYNNHLDFGWRYNKKFWGQGIGSEAAQLVLSFANDQFHFTKVVCICYPENYGSIRIIEKIGFQFEKKVVINNKTLLQFSKH